MPSVKSKTEQFWYITTLDGPWQVYSSRKRKGTSESEWGVVHVASGKHRKTSQTSTKRSKSPFEKAKDLAESLNAKERERVTRAGATGYNRQYLREDIRRALLDCATWPGAVCYERGVPGLVRRLQEINRVVGTLMQSLNDNDMYEFHTLDVYSSRAVSTLQQMKGE